MHALLCAWLALTATGGVSSQAGSTSSPTRTASRTGFVGIGYNLLTANPEGGREASGGTDPGLLLTRQVLDVSDPRAVQQQQRHSCSMARSVTMFYGAKSYQQKLQADVTIGGSAIAGLANFAFSLSPGFAEAQNETTLTSQVFRDEQTVCNLGRMRFAEELSDWLNVSVTDNFAAAACRLPEVYSSAYMDFLDNWGTHLTLEVDVGTRVIQRSRMSMTEFVHLVAKTSAVDVSLGGSYLGFGASIGVDFQSFASRDVASLNFGNYVTTLRVGSDAMPEPISLKLISIDQAFNPRYWRHVAEESARGLCDVDFNVAAIAENLRSALSEYAAYKMTPEVMDPPLKVPLTWPRGTYGLMKATSGCPAGVSWYEGWRYQDTEDPFTRNEISSPIHLSGRWVDNGNLRLEFCIKGAAQVSEWDVEWPAGDYCILKYGVCPTGFQEGFVQWNDEDISNDNEAGGTLPDGVYDDNTKIFFCCRDDGIPTEPIFLPPHSPFFLLRHTRGCQTVHNMGVREETVWWDEAVNTAFSPSPRQGGAHPLDDGDSSNHRLHFCYFSPSADSLVG